MAAGRPGVHVWRNGLSLTFTCQWAGPGETISKTSLGCPAESEGCLFMKGTEMPGESGSELDRLLPEWHFREVHRITVPGTTDQVMKAVRAATWSEAPLARVLVALTRADVSAERRIVSDYLSGMGEVIPAGDDEFLFAGVQSPHDVPRPPGTISEIVTGCHEPGILKVGMNVRFEGGTLSTETRVLATDARTRRSFAPYWWLVRFGSGLTRASMLRAIRRRLVREVGAA
ncbi:hypothetical protein [Streptomyces sp. MH13]|uniref:hypothetical protein n=1 Tax=Streptomyces sp. MH13 TaxID=3417651 RepID=UPI003CF2D79B